MNIAIIGYGRMGKEVERAACERKVRIMKVFNDTDNMHGLGLTKRALKDVDVCIEFTTPSAVIDNIEAAAGCGKNIVVGTTGWYDKLGEVKKIVHAKKIGLLYSPNFSIGMNIFFQVLNASAHIFEKFDIYDVAVSETHHQGKADSPSGTALALGQILLQHIRRKKEMLHETAHQALKPDQIHVTSTRLGKVVGEHRVIFDSEADTIELTHRAKNRGGFALGAVIAAEWLVGRKGIYTMKDFLTSL
jgi:4-hydroxy-tetrahydrodipicolinate reductase